MIKLKKGLAILLAVCLIAGLVPVLAATIDINSQLQTTASDTTVTIITEDTVWRYLDDGTDPAGDSSADGYNITSWTLDSFDDSAWKSAAGKFGSKRGALADLSTGYVPTVLLQHYINGSSNPTVPAYFFRTTVTLDKTYSGVISGTILYDDSAIIYINGTKVTGLHDSSLTGNLSYGGSNATAPTTATFSVEASCLKAGENIIAVEVHNGTNTSSDEWFSMPEVIIDESATAPKEGAVCITVGEDETMRNISWDSPSAATNAKVQYAKKDGDMFPNTYSEAVASVESSNNGGYYSCKATLTNLEANCEYVYRFVNGTTISDVYSFSTAASGSFSFLFMGDPQIGASGSVANDATAWANTVSVATTHFPNSKLLISSGDQVNSASNEEEYLGYFSPEELTSLTTATVIGNHDTGSNSYQKHFYNPNTKASDDSTYGATTAGCDYWYTYNDVLFLNLNTNNLSVAEHKAFMEDAIAQNPHVLWMVVVFHQSIYSVAGHAVNNDVLTLREQLVPIFTDLDIDVVLMGHDHVYVRSYMMNGFVPDTTNGVQSSVTDHSGILYMTACSSSGSKYYSILDSQFDYAAVKYQQNTPTYTNVQVTPTSFKISTYRTVDSVAIDEFEIKKSNANALEHTVEYVNAKSPECLENGNTAYYKCDDCGRWYEDEACTKEIEDKNSVVIAATGHLDVSHIDRVPANCLIDGNIEYWHCNDCGLNYKDSAYKKQADDVVIYSRGGHSGGETYYNDTYHWTLCEHCAEPYNREEHSDDCDCGYEKP